jgi:ribosomal-protein-alanine N-acetyltransferase
MEAIELVTDRLRLRPVVDADAISTAALMCDRIAANLTTWQPKTTVADASRRIADARLRFSMRQALDLSIFGRRSGEFLGWVSLFKDDERDDVARIGFWLGLDHQGQGLVSEAAPVAIASGATYLGVRGLEACVYPWNARGIRAIGKLGFEPAGSTALYSPVRERTEGTLLFGRSV